MPRKGRALVNLYMANRFALPKTIAVVTGAGFKCPAIVTPADYLKEDLDD